MRALICGSRKAVSSAAGYIGFFATFSMLEGTKSLQDTRCELLVDLGLLEISQAAFADASRFPEKRVVRHLLRPQSKVPKHLERAVAQLLENGQKQQTFLSNH